MCSQQKKNGAKSANSSKGKAPTKGPSKAKGSRKKWPWPIWPLLRYFLYACGWSCVHVMRVKIFGLRRVVDAFRCIIVPESLMWWNKPNCIIVILICFDYFLHSDLYASKFVFWLGSAIILFACHFPQSNPHLALHHSWWMRTRWSVLMVKRASLPGILTWGTLLLG